MPKLIAPPLPEPAEQRPGRRFSDLGRRVQARVWNGRVDSWEHSGAVGLERVIDSVLAAAEVEPGMVAVDLGAGTGQLSLPLASRGAQVLAVDLSGSMLDRLHEKAASMHIDHITGFVSPIEKFQLPPCSVDLVVSNYALHHLRDQDKERLVASSASWLRSGGRLVVGDMMFGRGAEPRDRAIIKSKMRTLVRRGPAGWWRLAKNIGRFTLRLQERPVGIETWKTYFERAGFAEIEAMVVVCEGAIVVGTKP